MGHKFHNLVSFALVKGEQSLDVLHPEWNTFLDSGGFTNFVTGKTHVTLDNYMHFLKQHGRRFWNYLALDRIGDKEVSERWLSIMQRKGLNPVPIFQRGDAEAEDLIKLLKGYPLVAIGGISQNLGAKAEQDYIRSIMRVVRTVKTSKVHLLGVGVREAKMYNPYSADSSTWASHTRFGILRLWYQGKLHVFQKHRTGQNKKDYIRPDPNRTKILLHYNLTWNDLGDNKLWSKSGGPIYIAACRSWMRQCLSLKRKGCNYVLAHFKFQTHDFREAWNYERVSWGWSQKLTVSLPDCRKSGRKAREKKPPKKVRKQKSRFTSDKMKKIKK
jgi:hypothetical protein